MEDKKELVARARAGEAHAFARLYEEIYQDLYRYAFFMLQNTQDAEDTVSEAVLAAYAGIRKLRDADAFRGWMFQIVTNICRRKRRQYLKKDIPLSDEIQGVEWTENTQEALDVRKALQTLSPQERQIIGMSILGGYSSQEIGRHMKLKSGTVRSKLSRSLAKMRNILPEYSNSFTINNREE